MLTAAHTINKMPFIPCNNMTPHEKLHGVQPSYNNMMRVFGCLCFKSTLKRDRHKLNEKANPCVFIGYSQHKKGYKVYNLKTKSVLVSRDVTFHEKCFPYRFKSFEKKLLKNLFIPKTNLPTDSTDMNMSYENIVPTYNQTYDEQEVIPNASINSDLPIESNNVRESEEDVTPTHDKSYDEKIVISHKNIDDLTKTKSIRIKKHPE